MPGTWAAVIDSPSSSQAQNVDCAGWLVWMTLMVPMGTWRWAKYSSACPTMPVITDRIATAVHAFHDSGHMSSPAVAIATGVAVTRATGITIAMNSHGCTPMRRIRFERSW